MEFINLYSILGKVNFVKILQAESNLQYTCMSYKMSRYSGHHRANYSHWKSNEKPFQEKITWVIIEADITFGSINLNGIWLELICQYICKAHMHVIVYIFTCILKYITFRSSIYIDLIDIEVLAINWSEKIERNRHCLQGYRSSPWFIIPIISVRDICCLQILWVSQWVIQLSIKGQRLSS